MRVLLGQRPSLRSLRRRSCAFVRLLRRYYAAVRLLAAVREGLAAHRVPPPVRIQLADGHEVSRFSRMKFSMHAWGLRLRRIGCALARFARRRVAFWSPDAISILKRVFRSSIPSLHRPLSNASSAASRPPSHGSGPEWFATPSLYDSFIRYFMPVYPGAIQAKPPAPPRTHARAITKLSGIGLKPAPHNLKRRSAKPPVPQSSIAATEPAFCGGQARSLRRALCPPDPPFRTAHHFSQPAAHEFLAC